MADKTKSLPGLPFLTKLPGITELPTQSGRNSICYQSNGVEAIPDNFSFKPSVHVRAVNKAPVQLVDGVMPWRNPTNYHRQQTTIDIMRKGSHRLPYGVGKTFFVKNGSLAPGMVASYLALQHKGNDLFVGNQMVPSGSSGRLINARKKARTKALSDIASDKAQLGENLAQFGMTIDSLARVGDDVLKSLTYARNLWRFKHFRRLDLNARKLRRLVREGKIPEVLADYWLAYWYGFKPLYEDSKGLIELGTEIYTGLPLVVHGRGRSVETHEDRRQLASMSSIEPPLVIEDFCDVRYQVHLSGKVRKNGDVVRALNRAGLVNLPSLGWELIPFSFMVDWAVPVGEALQALTATVGLSFLGASETIRWNRFVTASVRPDYVIGDKSQSAITTIRTFGQTREALAKFPTPELYAKDFYKGADRWATIGSLLVQQAKHLWR